MSIGTKPHFKREAVRDTAGIGTREWQRTGPPSAFGTGPPKSLIRHWLEENIHVTKFWEYQTFCHDVAEYCEQPNVPGEIKDKGNWQNWNWKWDLRVNMLQLWWGGVPSTVSGCGQLHHWATAAAAASPHLSTTTTGNAMMMMITFVFILFYNQSHRVRNTSKWEKKCLHFLQSYAYPLNSPQYN